MCESKARPYAGAAASPTTAKPAAPSHPTTVALRTGRRAPSRVRKSSDCAGSGATATPVAGGPYDESAPIAMVDGDEGHGEPRPVVWSERQRRIAAHSRVPVVCEHDSPRACRLDLERIGARSDRAGADQKGGVRPPVPEEMEDAACADRVDHPR